MQVTFVDVSVSRGRRPVLSHLSAEFSGNLDVILGLNGAGKSTLLQAMCGILRSQGRIEYDGQTLAAPAARLLKQELGFAPQSTRWPSAMRLESFLGYVARMRAVPSHVVSTNVEFALQTAGLARLRNSSIGKLSGGQARRLALAQALVHRPKLLILDEPTSELDPVFSGEFAQTIAALRESHHIIVTTQSLEDVFTWRGTNHILLPNALTPVPASNSQETFEQFSTRLRQLMGSL